LETGIVTGNEALALGALRAGAKVLTGYPGTPSSGALGSLLALGSDHPWLQGRHVEWSTNEKVAFEIAAGAAWAGQRALCTMKMSGLNVAYDSVISIAYSGCNGGLVIYVADDPGVSAGMAEQDSRGYALMSDLPMLEPASVAETYELTQVAFELSERTGSPIFLRLVTAIASSHAPVRVQEPAPPPGREPILERDIARYTKAGAAICMAQHHDLIARLEQAGELIHALGLNRLQLAEKPGGLGVVAAGVTAAYLEEGFEIAARFGFEREAVSTLRLAATNPLATQEVQALLGHCEALLVLEELEPHIERGVYVEAHQSGFRGRIVGKSFGGAHDRSFGGAHDRSFGKAVAVSLSNHRDTEDGLFSRVGEYGVRHVVQGIGKALGLPIPEDLFQGDAVVRRGSRQAAEALAAARPITVCAGCPHRGTYMAINRAIRKLRLKKDEVMVTGDIGCTILGMNPPFHTIWNEVSMGASIGLAQGYVYAGVRTPVIATIGDSTFFHGGIPALINAIQHQVPLTLIIMDNGWTSMTGMQVNPGTAEAFQPPGGQRVDMARFIPALGVERFYVIDPFDLEGAAATIQECMTLPGVKVVLARQECAIQAARRGLEAGEVRVEPDNCNLCKLCITMTGCPAIDLGEETVVIDPALCYGCGLCAQVCNREAIEVTNQRISESASRRISE
jgi:indolepyruvate ferredoxin oxidoreductase alpha subunit